MSLESHLRTRRAEGSSLLVPYVTGGLGEDWLDVVRALAAAGADAIEVGLPFSDPVMDGPTIQAASQQALEGGATPRGIVAAMAKLDVDVPLVVMTYYNPVYHLGVERFAASLADAGISGAIVPDLPIEELDDWGKAAEQSGIETVLLAAPTTPDERLARICERAHGFVYGVSLLGVTGARAQLSAQALDMGRRLKAATDLPALLGVGIGTPDQAVEASRIADGVIVGSAVVARVVSAGADGAYELVRSFRDALDRSAR